MLNFLFNHIIFDTISIHFFQFNKFVDRKALYDIKREISVCSKKNFQVEKDVRNLDNKIALLVRNKITLEVISIEN